MDTRIRLTIIPALAVICLTALLLFGLNYYVRYQIHSHMLENLIYTANAAASAVAAHGINHDIVHIRWRRVLPGLSRSWV